MIIKNCPPAEWIHLAQIAADELKLSRPGLFGRNYSRQYAHARRLVFRALRGAGYSYASIGRASGFHHTTIIYACKGEDYRAAKLDLKAARYAAFRAQLVGAITMPEFATEARG